MTQRFEIGCSPHRAFAGFTDPERIVEWWGDPLVYRTKSWASDLREGGRWRAEFEAPDGTSFGAEGEYLSVDRPTNLEWTWKADWEPEIEKTIRMAFNPSPSGIELVIETTGYRSEEAKVSDEAAWVDIIGWFNRTAGNRMADFRTQALELPGVIEQPHHGAPSFRINGKIFAQLSADGSRALVKLPLGVQEWGQSTFPTLCQSEPGRWGQSGWTRLLWMELPPPIIAELLEASWNAASSSRSKR